MQDINHLIPFGVQGKPERGLLREYIDFSRPLSCAPLQYHLFAGLLVPTKSGLMGNRVFVPLGAQRVCPHLWVALLGPSPLLRAAAAGMTRRILGRLGGQAPYKGTCLCRADQAGLESRQGRERRPSHLA